MHWVKLRGVSLILLLTNMLKTDIIFLAIIAVSPIMANMI